MITEEFITASEQSMATISMLASDVVAAVSDKNLDEGLKVLSLLVGHANTALAVLVAKIVYEKSKREER